MLSKTARDALKKVYSAKEWQVEKVKIERQVTTYSPFFTSVAQMKSTWEKHNDSIQLIKN